MQNFEIGINLRVTECLNQGMRAYMEDFATYYFEKSPDKPDSDRIRFAYFAVFDGHGGAEAAKYAKVHLLNEIKKIDGFWSTDDNAVLEAIRQGFINTHKAMWNERGNWAKTVRGLDSTAGTTASIAIVRNRKLYIGHVGDSAIVLGCRDNREQSRDLWQAQTLTVEHKPSNPKERERIERAGGSLMKKGGVYRVVWRRPAMASAGAATGSPQIQSSKQFETVPFLAVARSLGDLWSYDNDSSQFHVSPEPDVQCINLDYTKHKCLILGSDGLWNMVAPDSAVEMVRICERSTELKVFTDPDVPPNFFYNPSGSLVQLAMHRWMRADLRADNITALVVMLDPPGRPMSQLRSEQRDLTLARLGLQRESPTVIEGEVDAETEQPICLQDLLVHCEKWQNANRPGTNAHGHAAKTAAAAAAAAGRAPSALHGGSVGPLTAKPSIGQSLKRQASDRTLFSPAFKRSPVGAAALAAGATPADPDMVSFYLPVTPNQASASAPTPASGSAGSRRQTRSTATTASAAPVVVSTTGTATNSAAKSKQKPPQKEVVKKNSTPAAAASASATKKRRLSAGAQQAGSGAAGATVEACLKRLRRRKTLR